ncbi:MAG TPA: DUF4838 domain-containing protein, partial [Verrucomicrobiae bacterium]|nr:DUF4838 domain-containing protein [Verrucomicrobiae bacterium]
SEKITQQILDDGYRPAVWSWRRGDTEVRFGDPGLRIRIHGVMGDYFHGLPDSARKLEWHNIERNHHGIANDVNYYVASKLMWDPKTDVDAALNKYCSLVFGKPNAAAVAQAFLVIEASRDVQKDVSRSIIEHPATGADRARRALAALEVVKLPPGHRSRLPSVTSPEEMLQELRGTLAVIAENAEIAATQLPALDNFVRDGQSEKAKALAAELNEQAGKWFGAISGGMEGLWLKETVAARLKGKAGEQAHNWFGFWTRNLASFEQKDSQYTIGGQGKAPATALLELQPPARHRVEFHFQCLVASSGKARNAGFAFGAGRNMDDLVRCEAFIRGRELRLRGAKLQKPATVAAPDLDPSQPLPCAVTIDLDRHLLNFKAGAYSARAELDPSVREVGWYGYVVEHTRTRFDQITVSRAE